MPPISQWIQQRLKKIPLEEFVGGASHRVPEENSAFIHEYYAVPLASGCGTAFLTAPSQFLVSDPNATLVLFFHGLGQDSASPFFHWIDDLAARGFAVLSIDWDGHGAGASSFLDLQEATRSIPLIVQRLYGETGGVGLNEKRAGPHLFLMGYSFGASLSLIAATRPEMARLIAGVVAISPIICVQSSSRIATELASFLSPAAWLTDFANKLRRYGLKSLVPSYGSLRRKTHPLRLKVNIDYVDQARCFAAETFQERRILERVKTPVLWCHGLRDAVSPYYQTFSLMTSINAAFFSICDQSRGHMRMMFCDRVSLAAQQFMSRQVTFSQTQIHSST